MKSEKMKIARYALDSKEWKDILDRIEKEARETIQYIGSDMYITEKDREKWSYCMKH